MERFWNKVRKIKICWNWSASKDKDGYGRIKMNGRPRPAHRVVWELTYGVIPQGLQVLHTCDNTSCVNPSHLFLGDNDDNVADKVSKQRQSRQENHGRARLLGSDVIIIRFLRKYHHKEFTLKQIGAYYGVSITHVYQIEQNLRWKTSKPMNKSGEIKPKKEQSYRLQGLLIT